MSGQGLSKSGGAVRLDLKSAEDANTNVVYEKNGNENDEQDMDRMGKLQELRVSVACRVEAGYCIGMLMSE